MMSRRLRRVLLLTLLCWTVGACTAAAQSVFSSPGTNNHFGGLTSLDNIQTTRIDSNLFLINGQNSDANTPLQTPSGSISKLDRKAPAGARHEYEKGYQLLMKKDLEAAIAHLAKSIEVYPSFVAAHNALGTAYMSRGQNQQAREEFARAVALDDHLPNSYLNLGCAQLALQQYPDAEESLKKASSIAPLDLPLLTALTYAEFVNHDYPAVLATAHQVHGGKHHEGAAMVHYFAAGALEAQDNLVGAQGEMETLLKEDPKSPSIADFRQILDQIKAEQVSRAAAKLHPAAAVRPSTSPSFSGPTAEEVSRRAQQAIQNKKEEIQIAEAEAEPDPTCIDCRPTAPIEPTAVPSPAPASEKARASASGAMLRVAVDEVAIFFAATDHGRSVTNLAASDIEIRDNSRVPETILAFRNEAELPLRLGLIIDTSNSVTERFSFEQAAATKFLKMVVTGKYDLAFVVGVNNSVLMVQDFTADQTLAERAVGQLAPGGGTALWDAVAFAADKLAKRPETQPVARILVVISDGEDNSSTTTLKQAVGRAQLGEVAVYTVSTRDHAREEPTGLIGDRALKTLSELTGGTAFMPGSVHGLNGSLADLQQVIRGRYFLSYKPSAFQLDGRYRAVDIKAEKEGHKLTVYARKGYYAAPVQDSSSDH
jgi:Ca-activated chloride channel family protein